MVADVVKSSAGCHVDAVVLGAIFHVGDGIGLQDGVVVIIVLELLMGCKKPQSVSQRTYPEVPLSVFDGMFHVEECWHFWQDALYLSHGSHVIESASVGAEIHVAVGCWGASYYEI